MPRQRLTSIPLLPSMQIAGRAMAAIALALALSACAPSALTTARSQIDAANYPAARQELVALSARTDLTDSERRELKDDLCLCDFKIGRPAYTLAEQRAVCIDASKEPGSQAGSIIAQIDQAERDRDAQEVDAALGAHDLADAERAATDYQRMPGYDAATSRAMVQANLDAGRRAGVRRFRREEALPRRRDFRSPQEPSRRRKDEPKPVRSMGRRDCDRLRHRARVERRG